MTFAQFKPLRLRRFPPRNLHLERSRNSSPRFSRNGSVPGSTGGVYKGHGRNQRELITHTYYEFLTLSIPSDDILKPELQPYIVGFIEDCYASTLDSKLRTGKRSLRLQRLSESKESWKKRFRESPTHRQKRYSEVLIKQMRERRTDNGKCH
uniref:Uncharacterized protein n=1 Tax=Ascaris lumbricoides TaxID=6252 RepID=A0A0M3HF01_ASCLU